MYIIFVCLCITDSASTFAPLTQICNQFYISACTQRPNGAYKYASKTVVHTLTDPLMATRGHCYCAFQGIPEERHTPKTSSNNKTKYTLHLWHIICCQGPQCFNLPFIIYRIID